MEFNIFTIIINVVSIVVNIGIARYNVGKNRKIYEVKTISTLGVDDINKELKKGDYTILSVGQGNHIGAVMYVLGKLKWIKNN